MFFRNCREMMKELREDLAFLGTKVGETRELIGVSFELTEWKDRDKIIPNLSFCRREFFERMSPERNHNPGKAWEKDKKRLGRYRDKSSGRFSYTYADRMGNLHKVMENLKENPNSRREFISIWNEGVDSYERDWAPKYKKYTWIPCSIGYHFLNREGKMELVYMMRSANIDWLPTDIWLATKILEHAAKYCNVKPGLLTVFISSLHEFKRRKR